MGRELFAEDDAFREEVVRVDRSFAAAAGRSFLDEGLFAGAAAGPGAEAALRERSPAAIVAFQLGAVRPEDGTDRRKERQAGRRKRTSRERRRTRGKGKQAWGDKKKKKSIWRRLKAIWGQRV